MGEGQYLYRTTGVHSLQAIKQIGKTGEARNALDSIECRDVQAQHCIVTFSYSLHLGALHVCAEHRFVYNLSSPLPVPMPTTSH